MKRIICIAKAVLIIMLLTNIAFAGAPVDGVYEKRDENDRLMAKLIVVSPHDKFGSDWSAATDAPYIELIAYDEDGEQYELSTQYIWKTDKMGAFERGVYFSRNDIEEMKQCKLATGKRLGFGMNFGEMENISGKVIRANIHSGNQATDRMLSGVYEKTGDDDGQPIIPSMLMFICEKLYAPEVFSSERNIPCSIRMLTTEGRTFPFDMTKYEIKKGSAAAFEYYVDNKKRIIMRFNSKKLEYSFPYVSEGYLTESAAEWGQVKPTASSEVNALKLHHFIMSNAEHSRLLTKDSVLRFADFYSGEGKKAVTTCQYLLVDKKPGGIEVKKLRAVVQDNGKIEVFNPSKDPFLAPGYGGDYKATGVSFHIPL